MERFFKQFQDQGQGGKNRWHSQPNRRAVGLGSGFFISEDGYVVTNNHVVDGSSDFMVTDADGTEFPAKLIGKDPKTDLALLKVDSDKKFTYVEFAPGKVRVGEWVMAVGNPFGLGGTVTTGIVSALGRDIGASSYDDFIQIDASVNKGNSGGPTFNLNGQVIGINTAIYSPSGGSVGIAFAIPAETAQRVIADLKDHGEVVRGWLGVSPTTGEPFLPPATKKTSDQGTGLYLIEDLLCDEDLFRRLRMRGESRGADGLEDLRLALRLVAGTPYDGIRARGGAWLADSMLRGLGIGGFTQPTITAS